MNDEYHVRFEYYLNSQHSNRNEEVVQNFLQMHTIYSLEKVCGMNEARSKKESCWYMSK